MKKSHDAIKTTAKHAPHPPAKHTRKDDGNAFFPDPGEGPAVVKDELAEELAEEFLIAATSGEEVAVDVFNADVPEDDGGPFIPDEASIVGTPARARVQ